MDDFDLERDLEDAGSSLSDLASMGKDEPRSAPGAPEGSDPEGEAKLAAATPRPTVKPQVTPKPAYATPKRTTSTPKPTPKSAPFNAREYTDPDDFYFDYYDDFYDYEDAEDYWNDWND